MKTDGRRNVWVCEHEALHCQRLRLREGRRAAIGRGQIGVRQPPRRDDGVGEPERARRPEVPDLFTSGLDTVGVRVPAHPAARIGIPQTVRQHR